MTVEDVMAALKTVMDPEVPVSVVDLGLIQEVNVEGRQVDIVLTVTSLGCACVDWIEEDVRRAVLGVPGVEAVHVEVSFQRAWNPGQMTPLARRELVKWGIRA